jgi:hypothetical protein
MPSLARFGTVAKIFGAWMVFLLLIACGSVNTDTTDPDPVVAPSTDPAPAADEAAPAAGGGACSRMAACCRAYVAAMGATVPASTCDAYNDVSNMPDSMCSQSMAGYRAGLQAMQKAVPSECN